jgi:serine phosphatase RsbU (regulator of sigma subunit)
MATFQASLKTLAATSCSLAELVDRMNRYICSNSQSGLRFTTALLGEYDSPTRTFTYINAGHNAPMLRRASGSIERLDVGGVPLGIHSESPYETGKVVLAPDDWLLIFTDGVVEAVNNTAEEYGETRLLSVLHSGISTTPPKLLSRIMVDLDLFVGSTPQHDDITCMLVKSNS